MPDTVSEKRNRTYKVRDPLERFMEKVDKTGDCWLWTAATSKGYGVFRIGSKARGTSRVRGAHIWLWELENGPLPEGLELDHLCRTPACVRPSHVEPVTHAENIRRGKWGGTSGPAAENAAKTHCKRGHELAGANLYIYKRNRNGRESVERGCNTCRRATAKEASRRRRQP